MSSWRRALRDLALTANLTDRMLLLDVDREGGESDLGNQCAVLTEDFTAKIDRPTTAGAGGHSKGHATLMGFDRIVAVFALLH